MENLNRFSEIYRVVLQINPILSGSFSEEYGDDVAVADDDAAVFVIA